LSQLKENRTNTSIDVADLAKVNYHPNALAGSLSSKRTRIIGIIMRNIRNPFYPATLIFFYKRLSEIGNYPAVRQIADRLVDPGHKHFAFIEIL